MFQQGKLVPIEIKHLLDNYCKEQQLKSGQKPRLSEDEIEEAIAKLEAQSKKQDGK